MTELREPFLRTERLVRRFGAFAALDGINLEISRGEFVCFLGPSGCGKTTLLRTIAGLERQDAGKVFMDGRDISDAPPHARNFGIVFQSYALFPNLTVSANVGYGLKRRVRARKQTDDRVAELLDLVGLSNSGSKYPSQLSGGQQQRVALARALATDPALLLLDEPLSALDARVRVHLREQIRGIQGRLGITTIMVTHDQEEAIVMADRVVVMQHGKIEQVGTPQSIYRQPRSSFVSDFVGVTTGLKAVVLAPNRVKVESLELVCAEDISAIPNSEVKVAFRPEAVQVRNVRPDAANWLEAEIKDLKFLGAFWRAELIPYLARNNIFLADLSENAMRDLKFERGQHISICVAPRDILVFGNVDK